MLHHFHVHEPNQLVGKRSCLDGKPLSYVQSMHGECLSGLVKMPASQTDRQHGDGDGDPVFALDFLHCPMADTGQSLPRY